MAARLNQISHPPQFKALRKPPNALSRQGSVLSADFARAGIAVRLISAVLGFALGMAAVSFFGLGSGRWRLIILGGSEALTAGVSERGVRSLTIAGCAGGSGFVATTSSRSAFANASCDPEIPSCVSARVSARMTRGSTAAAALRGGVRSSIAASTPTPNGMRRPNNNILSKMRLQRGPCRWQFSDPMRQSGGSPRNNLTCAPGVCRQG